MDRLTQLKSSLALCLLRGLGFYGPQTLALIPLEFLLEVAATDVENLRGG